MTPDKINGTFELLGSVFIMLSIWKLYRDKLVRGISWWHVGFFSAWGYWNIYYYSSLDQWWSWSAGILLAFTNTAYLIMLLYYTKKEKHLCQK